MEQQLTTIWTSVFLDKEQFGQLFHKYYEPLCYYACSIVRSKETADELVQGVFVKLWEDKDHLRIQTSIVAYLYKSVHNSCLNFLEHSKVKDRVSDMFLKEYKDLISPRSMEYPTANLLVQELSGVIQKAISDLPDQCREVFIKVRQEEMSYAQVADLLGVSVNTVKTQLQRAMAKLRASLQDYM